MQESFGGPEQKTFSADQFVMLINRIMEVQWKKAMTLGQRTYNIKLYNIDKLSPKKAKELYLHLASKFYLDGKQTQAWHENELRVFIWVLVTYSYVLKRPIADFGDNEWQYLSKLFCGKNPWLCQFQYMNIRKVSAKNQKWSKDEDDLLVDIVNSRIDRNKWNQIAKLFFYNSGRRLFRTAKQCRERWNNYLDPWKDRGHWTTEEDRLLVDFVLKDGKKWALIAKSLEGRRTEHMVKNRYKSLLTKQLKTMKDIDGTPEEIVLQLIMDKMVPNGRGIGTACSLDKLEDSSVSVDNTLLKSEPAFCKINQELNICQPNSPRSPILKELEIQEIQFFNKNELLFVDELDFSQSNTHRNPYSHYFQEDYMPI